MIMKSISLATVGVALALAAASAPAAGLILGSFEGIATGSRYDALGPDGSSFDGEVVSGTFSIDTSVAATFTSLQPDYRWNVVPASAVGMTVFAHGQTVMFGNASPNGTSSFVSLATSGGQRVASITVDGADPYHNALIQLSGPLFDGLDLTTLHAATVDLSQSSIGFFAGRSFGSGVTLTSLSLTSPVPEPLTAWSMTLGLAVLALARSLTRRAASSPAQAGPSRRL